MTRRHSMLSTHAIIEPKLDSEELLNRARAGDAVGLEWIYNGHALALYRTAYRLLASRADAEDVVHDLFVGLPEALQGYDERGSLGAWLNRIVVRLALMRARSERRRRTEPFVEAQGVASASRTDALLDAGEVYRALAALPFDLRAVFILAS